MRDARDRLIDAALGLAALEAAIHDENARIRGLACERETPCWKTNPGVVESFCHACLDKNGAIDERKKMKAQRQSKRATLIRAKACFDDTTWAKMRVMRGSRMVRRPAHNRKVVGSNPTPASTP